MENEQRMGINKQYISKAMAVLPAVVLISLGISLCIRAELGADVYTSFQQAIAGHLDMNVGSVNLVMSIFVIIAFFFIDKLLINIGSVFMALGIGPLMTMFINLLDVLIVGVLPLGVRLLMVVIGSTFIALALSWYIPINLGVQPLDMLIIATSRIIKKSFGTGMYAFNFSMFVGTIMLGGTIGLGTIISFVLTGKLVDIMMPRIEPLMLKLVNK